MSHDLVAQARTIITAQKADFEKVAVDNQIKFEREAGFAMQILQGNDYTMSVAVKNPTALKNAIINVSAIGVSLNPASKQAYLVPRKGVVCLDISYMGMMHIAQQCGAIQWGQAVIVREHDTFTLNGLDKLPTHVYDPFATDRGAIRGAYCVVKTDTGDYLTHTMPVSAINDIMNRSESVKAGKSSPWKTDYEEMAKKTVVKQASKYWPRRDRLDSAVHYMNTDGGEGLAQEKDVTPPPVDDATEKRRAEFIVAVNKCADLDSLAELQVQTKATLQALGDGVSWVLARGEINRRKEEIEKSGTADFVNQMNEAEQ